MLRVRAAKAFQSTASGSEAELCSGSELPPPWLSPSATEILAQSTCRLTWSGVVSSGPPLYQFWSSLATQPMKPSAIDFCGTFRALVAESGLQSA